jgi:UDP-N-acetylmuramoyl-tripeptide--D-alanyl-D-alanine ligase
VNPFTIRDVLDATGARLVHGDGDRRATGVSTDTRTLAAGDLFVALAGPNFDGHRFARSAVERGAAGLVLEAAGGAPPPAVSELPRDTPVLLHPSPRRALSSLASWHRARLRAPVVGITGSCGKTTTKNILLELLADRRAAVGSPNSFNNDIGVPHTLFLADENSQAVVVEMGTNHPGEIEALCRTARPTGGVVTCVGASHLEGLGSVEGVAKEKAALVESLPADGFCVLNADCSWTAAMRRRTRASVTTFSVEGEGDLNASEIWSHGGGTTFKLDGEEITSPLLGLHNVQNLLAALAACRGLGIALEEVLPAVSRLRACRRRLERIQAGRLTIIDDSYNANPESARASVRVLAGLHGHARRVLVLGDMLELGASAEEQHKRIGLETAQAGIDVLVAVGELARSAAAGAIEGGMPESSVVSIASTDDAIACAPALVRAGDVVLVKGSHRTGLDRLVQRLVAFLREDAA